MAKVTADQIRQLREETGAPILRAKKILEEEIDKNKGKYSPEVVKRAREILQKEGFEKMAKRTDRVTGAGIVSAYSHHTGKVASLVELLCETDFVAKNDLFLKLGNEVAMQVASMDPKNEKELLGMAFIKDPTKNIEELIKEVTTKTGENIRLGKFVRVEVGKN